ncbi:MAG: GntR family transcriptional regulator [Desulfobacterales bacterium]
MRQKAIPLYYQIETILRGRILSGELPSGASLPTEETLGREFNVSRITVRRSLSELENDGLIVRQRGRGTFVTDKPHPATSSRFSGSMEDLINMSGHTEAKVLAFEMIDAPDQIRAKLNLEDGDRILRIEKIRSVEDEPFSYVINYLPEKIGARLSAADLNQKPLLMILEDEFGLNADGAIQTIEAVVAEPESAPLLGIRVGDPLLKVERTVFDAEDHPLEYVSVLYRADKYYFNVRLKRERSEDSIGWAPTKIK